MTRRSALLGLLGLLAALLGPGGPLLAPAAPAAAERGPGPLERAGPTVSLVGNGYGHGHGMSQHGAQSRAVAGHTYRQILAFYYPGLRWGEARGYLRVLLTADTSADVVVRARSGLRVGRVGSRTTYPLSQAGVAWWRLVAADGGRVTQVQSRTARGSWRVVRGLRGEAQVSAGGAPVTLRTPTGDVAYRGFLRSAAAGAGGTARDTVNVLAFDSYLRGVVPREVPASWSPHAVRAQSVAARTYAASDRARAGSRHYDTCDTTQCQVYGGYASEHPDSNAAIAATAGQVLLASGQPAFTQFSASNGGWSSQGSTAYLPAKQDTFDRAYRHWTDSVTAAEIQRAFPAIGTFRRVAVLSRDGNGEWGGRVERIRLVGARASTTVTGDTFRSYFGLRSSWFRVS